jgi:hypothetical protein
MAEKKANKLQVPGLNNVSTHTWLISKYSKKYNTEIVVFNPFRKLNKKNAQNTSMALAS